MGCHFFLEGVGKKRVRVLSAYEADPSRVSSCALSPYSAACWLSESQFVCLGARAPQLPPNRGWCTNAWGGSQDRLQMYYHYGRVF